MTSHTSYALPSHRQKKLSFSGVLITVCFLLLLLNTKVSVMGAKSGLLLWFHTVLPILLPFMIMSNLLIALDTLHYITFLLEPPARVLLHISPKASYAILTGLLCGYPMGAKSTADLLEHNKISKEEARFLLHFCNNISPAFIISFICGTIFHAYNLTSFFLISLCFAPILCGMLLYPFYKKSLRNTAVSPQVESSHSPAFSFSLFDTAIMNGFESITKLGGYIILFSILSAWFNSLTIIGEGVKCFLLGITEFTTGIYYIGNSSLPIHSRILCVCACASFGGLSGIAQTQSMIKNSGIPILYYIIGKLLCCVLAVLIMSICLALFCPCPG